MVEASAELAPASLVLLRHPRGGEGAQGRPTPPVTLLALAGAARDAGAHDVRVLDGALLRDDRELATRLRAARPATVVLDGEDRSAAELASDVRTLRDLAPEARLVVRPPHGRDLREDVPGADVVLGGAPSSLGALLRSDGEPSSIPGLAWRDADGALRTGRATPETPVLEHAATLAWDLVDPRTYGLPLGSAALVTARACPPGCPSCHHSFGRTVRFRPLDELEAEVRRLVAGGARELVLLDEAFDHDPAHALAVARLLERVGPGRLVLANPLLGVGVESELAQALSAAGLRTATLQAGPPPRLQGLLRRHQDRNALLAGGRALTSAGVALELELTLGWPGEDAADRRATARLAWALPWTRLRVQTAWESPAAAGLSSMLPTPSRGRVLRDAWGLRLLSALRPSPWLRRLRR